MMSLQQTLQKGRGGSETLTLSWLLQLYSSLSPKTRIVRFWRKETVVDIYIDSLD